MGVELHITRAEFWAENDDSPITAEEWLSYIGTDPELSLDRSCGEYFARWSGPSACGEPWLEWFQGNISTKWPDTALYLKMLQVAQALGASVQDDEGAFYPEAGDWEYHPGLPGRHTDA
jgi:hypothetical protein